MAGPAALKSLPSTPSHDSKAIVTGKERLRRTLVEADLCSGNLDRRDQSLKGSKCSSGALMRNLSPIISGKCKKRSPPSASRPFLMVRFSCMNGFLVISGG